MSDLHLGHGFHLPIDAATQTLLLVGKRGSGKSSTATRFAEQLIDARIPIAVLDPVDVWWGLKAGADGAREGGKEVYVFGGRHADLPLEPTVAAGELLADVLVDHRVNLILCVRGMTEGEKAKVATGFADRLYKRNQEPVHIFCEEAHRFMPQTRRERGAEENIMLNRVLRLFTEGRSSGIGLTAVTQRPAALHKDATTQAEILVAHRLIGPQDVDAVEGWIQHHHQEKLKQQVLSTLPELKTGETWVWAPDFPEDKPIGLQRVRILAPVTFDSRLTPKPGARRPEPKQLAAVDLEKLRAKMASTIERAKQSNVPTLQAEIARLRAELATKAAPATMQPARLERVEVPVLTDKHVRQLEAVAHALEKSIRPAEQLANRLVTYSQQVTEQVSAVRTAAQSLVEAMREAIGAAQRRANGSRHTTAAAVQPAMRTLNAPARVAPARREIRDGTLTTQAYKMLQEAARRHPMRLTPGQLATLSGYSLRSSTFAPSLRQLLTTGYLARSGQELHVTDAGLAAAQVTTQLPADPETTLAMWLEKLPRQASVMLRAVWDSHEPLSMQKLAEQTGYSFTSSTFSPSLQLLVRNGLVSIGDDAMVAIGEALMVGVR